MSEKRIVVDTNVIVSGLLGKGAPGKIVEAWLFGFIFPVVSRELKTEVNDVLQRAHIKRRLGVTGAKNIRATVGTLFNKALTVLPKSIEETVFSDEDDHFLYELAITAGAAIIVTGDQALLRIGHIKGIEILSPRQFCRRARIK